MAGAALSSSNGEDGGLDGLLLPTGRLSSSPVSGGQPDDEPMMVATADGNCTATAGAAGNFSAHETKTKKKKKLI